MVSVFILLMDVQVFQYFSRNSFSNRISRWSNFGSLKKLYMILIKIRSSKKISET